MPKMSAGLLLWKREAGALRVLLVHPGGPFWAKKDAGAWTIPKGEVDANEEPLVAARREFVEELGMAAPPQAVPLGEVRQKGGKVVIGFAAEGEFDLETLRSNTFELEWPPRSGKRRAFPEVDRAQWFSLDEARAMINPAQRDFLDRLAQTV
jgi:predicted NUDIX family NTP pyrophosphohydrolase